MNGKTRNLPRYVATLIVAWPAYLWIIAFVIGQIANLNGCTIWALGPEECMFFGADIGDFLYPLWALGYWAVLVVFWIPIGWILVRIIEYARK